jgi:hypothetical protein
MAINDPIDINKAVITRDAFLIDIQTVGELNDTQPVDLQLPKGLPLKLVGVSAVVTAATANTATQVMRLIKVDVDGTATTICTWAGALLTNLAAGVILANPTFDVSESTFEDGGKLRVEMDWGAADTAECRVFATFARA